MRLACVKCNVHLEFLIIDLCKICEKVQFLKCCQLFLTYLCTWLHFSASQMWLLGRIMPLIVGERIPEDDERWILFLKLMDIIDILFTPRTSEDYAVYVDTLINDHHNEFSKLYQDSSIIPKMHFMVHMPRLMIK